MWNVSTDRERNEGGGGGGGRRGGDEVLCQIKVGEDRVFSRTIDQHVLQLQTQA